MRLRRGGPLLGPGRCAVLSPQWVESGYKNGVCPDIFHTVMAAAWYDQREAWRCV